MVKAWLEDERIQAGYGLSRRLQGGADTEKRPMICDVHAQGRPDNDKRGIEDH